MNPLAILLTVGLAWLMGNMGALAAPGLIPLPMEVTEGEGQFLLTNKTTIVAPDEAAATAQYLADVLAPATGFRLGVTRERSDDNFLELRLDESLSDKLGNEGYALEVTSSRVTIVAPKPAGLFYGIQTLRQLLPPSIFRSAHVKEVDWVIPCLTITDAPRFEWRGLLIDPARHFIPKADVLRFIDAMALHKYNRLQIHLTDSEGWRIEIKKYPLLTEIGSKWYFRMDESLDESHLYGGYYTQEDLREIIRYAADRHIVVVPEIEMPFHAGAAIAAYPELGPNPDELAAIPAAKRRLHTSHLVVPSRQTVKFFQNVLDEVIELFPSPYIHIGGDEANSQVWATLPEMQEHMRSEGLADVHELHSWFIRQMDDHITKRGRKLIGWDEILEGGLAKGATVMSWRGTAGGVDAAKRGHDVIMAPMSHTYFDFLQKLEGEEEFLGLHATLVVSLPTVYTFEPIPAELTPDEARHVLGGQGQLWGEFIPNAQHRDYQTYPRACALVEKLWSPKDHSTFDDFSSRLKLHVERLDAAGINYRPLRDLDDRDNQ
jgi:hexosaminidase